MTIARNSPPTPSCGWPLRPRMIKNSATVRAPSPMGTMRSTESIVITRYPCPAEKGLISTSSTVSIKKEECRSQKQPDGGNLLRPMLVYPRKANKKRHDPCQCQDGCQP